MLRVVGARRLKRSRKLAVRSCGALLAGAALLLGPSSVTAESSRGAHTPKGSLFFACASQMANLRVYGSESEGYEAVVLVATVGGTSYYSGSSYLSGASTTVTYERGWFVAEIPVRTTAPPSGPVVGFLTVRAELVEGRLQVISFGGGRGSGDTNLQSVSIARYRQLTPRDEVKLVAPNGAVAVVGGCSGTLSMGASSVQSDPQALVDVATHAGAECEPITLDGHSYGVFVPETRTPPDTAELFVVRADEEWGSSYVGNAGEGSTLASWGRGVAFDLRDGAGNVGATANVRFVAEESSVVPVVSGTWTSRLQVTIGRVEGVLTRPDGAMARVSCHAFSVEDRYVRAGGAPSTSAAPANDAPAGAIALAAGKEATVNTAGASGAPEVPLECMADPEGAAGVTNTVWFTVTGAGPMTIDTAGTRFDSVVAVYVRHAAGGLTPVPEACVDDTWTPLGPMLRVLNLQASVTFDAEPGVTYFVQAGGTEADRNVGTLRVAVR